MIEFDAIVGRPTPDDASSNPDVVPQVRGIPLTDVTAGIGLVLWVVLAGLWLADWQALSLVELFLCLAMLVLVPLGLGIASTPRRAGGTARLYSIAVLGQLPAAVAAMGGFTYEPGTIQRAVLLGPWATLTLTVGLFGTWRLLSHGLDPLPELSIDAALLYVPIAGIFLLLHALEITFHFQPEIVLLTGIHFHYAGFVLPLVVGRAGRIAAVDGSFGDDRFGRVAAASTIGIITGISLVAIAITLASVLELPAVVIFAAAILGTVGTIFRTVITSSSPLPAALLTIASISIVVTIGLALAYAYSVFPGTARLIGLHQMIHWHGTINALGFALPALSAIRLLQ
jgi:hypothetical protein